ncbi:MAG: ATP-binding protein [Anaerovoracaceae bacterium]
MSYTFNISLSILNHLGRNLYRNFITVIGEAISNSWDADAENVWIEIDKDSRTMYIVDDGIGMSDTDFQDKFLKIGYSKRNTTSISTKGRPFIGRKGIGKLALLSCAKKVHIATKASGQSVIGGLIDNSGLDQAISDDISANNYPLENFASTVGEKLAHLDSGAAIFFDELNDGVINTTDYLKKAIALYFRFSLLDSSFNIFLNGEQVTLDSLNDLSSATQYVWQINDINDPYLSSKLSAANANIKNYKKTSSTMNLKGFIATTQKPSNLKIRGTNEKVSLDLFVNGRLRERDILKHIPTARIVESYTYGQIHFDELDYDTDAFTSSREGVITDDPKFKDFIAEIESIFRTIIDEWDKLRVDNGHDGDPDNLNISPKKRKARELFSATVDEIVPQEIVKADAEGLISQWVKLLGEESQFNIPSYTECFIAENLLRKYIQQHSVALTKEASEAIEKWRGRETTSKEAANISFEIRQNNNDLQYLDMDSLSNLVDKPDQRTKEAGIARSARVYKPVRDAVGHTALLTTLAKQQLNIEFNNIQARLQKLLDNRTEENDDR